MSNDSIQGAQPPEIVRSEPWLADGNIVLQAGNTQFKVHRSVLGRHSTAFFDLLGDNLPQPPGEPSVEGCPVIVVQDRSDDLRHMLLALYDKVYNQHGPIPFEVVAAMARMGMKYDIKVLRDEAVARLKLEIPITLEKVGKAISRIGQVEGTHIAHEPRLLYKMINLAVECGIQTVLPSAFYLCQLPTVNIPPQMPRPPLHYPEYLATGKEEEGYLAPSTKCLISLGREKLFQRFLHVFGWVEVSDPYKWGCGCPEDISETRERLHGNLWRPFPMLEYIFKSWEDIDSEFRYHEHYGPEPIYPPLDEIFCSECYDYSTAEFFRWQRETWDELPELFGLGPKWEDLKDFGGM